MIIVGVNLTEVYEADFGTPLFAAITHVSIRLDEMREWSEEYGKPPEDQWHYIWNQIMPNLLPGAKMVFVKPPKVWSKE